LRQYYTAGTTKLHIIGWFNFRENLYDA
jgi:hypothetical protein